MLQWLSAKSENELFIHCPDGNISVGRQDVAVETEAGESEVTAVVAHDVSSVDPITTSNNAFKSFHPMYCAIHFLNLKSHIHLSLEQS